MRTTLIIAALTCYLIPCNSQEFSFEMYFEDAKGNKDTLIFGYDESATDTVDAQFGEVEYFGTKLTKEFEVFTSPYLKQEYKLQFPLLKKNIESKGNFQPHNILIKCKNLPLTITWDSTLFYNAIFNSSIITDYHPGGWFDASHGNEVGIFKLNQHSKAVFPYLGAYDVIVNHLNEQDTFRMVHFSFTTDDYVNIKETINELISLVPNPTKNSFTINLPSHYQFDRLQIYSMQGKLIKESSDLYVDVSEIPMGVYLVNVFTNNGINKFTATLKKE